MSDTLTPASTSPLDRAARALMKASGQFTPQQVDREAANDTFYWKSATADARIVLEAAGPDIADAEHMRAALNAVAALADEWDEQGISFFTGTRPSDLIRARIAMPATEDQDPAPQEKP